MERTPPTTQRRAVGYLRVSTEDQAREGVSLAAQEAKIRAWCLLNEYELLAVYTDAGISGKSAANRPGLAQALTECDTGAVLIVYSLSRLARSTMDTIQIAERLQRAGSDLVSLTERIDTTTAAGRLFFRLMAVLAEFERELIVERTRAAIGHKRAKGERLGKGPTAPGWGPTARRWRRTRESARCWRGSGGCGPRAWACARSPPRWRRC